MTRTCCVVLGLCCALTSCGENFTAGGGAAGTAGVSSEAGSGGEGNNAGQASAGSNSAGSGGDVSVAGSGADGGTGGALPVIGGSGGSGGSGGAPEEMPIPALGLTVWLRADRGVQQQAGAVSVWLDQSGRQTNATQLGLNSRPKLVESSLKLPALEFDGVDDFLKFGPGFSEFDRGLSTFIVASPSEADCASIIELSNGSEMEDVGFGLWQNQWIFEVANEFLQTGMVNLKGFSLYGAVQRMGGSSEIRADGSTLAEKTFPVASDSMRVNNFIGHTLYQNCNYFHGQIAEIIIYSRPVAAKEIATIETYLSEHWKLGSQVTPGPAPAQ